jgi:hypothetical protein
MEEIRKSLNNHSSTFSRSELLQMCLDVFWKQTMAEYDKNVAEKERRAAYNAPNDRDFWDEVSKGNADWPGGNQFRRDF